MTTADDLRALADIANAGAVELDADAATITEQAGLLGAAANIIADLRQRLADCESPTPGGEYLFGVTRASLPAFMNELAPATIQAERTYEVSGPTPWPNVASIYSRGHVPAVSFKGTSDTYADTIGHAFAGKGPVYLSYHHEIEDEIPGLYPTPEAYAADFDRIMARITPLAPNVIPTVILMAPTFARADVGRYLPHTAKMIGADGYDWNGCKTPAHYRDASVVFAGVPEFAAANGLPWGIFETNAPVGEPRKVEYIDSLHAFCKARHPDIVLAFDQAIQGQPCDWRSTGHADVMSAWRRMATDRAWS